VSLGGLVLIHILPELLEHGGFLTIVFVVIGIWGPTLSERVFHRHSEMTHNVTLALGIGGLLLHTITDGGALILAQQSGNSPLLALGIILHRLPVGVAIWWLLKPQIGSRWSMLVLTTMILLTVVGYFAGEQFLSQLSLENTVYLQSFVTGSILHVVLHQPHGQPPSDKLGQFEYQAGIGSLFGIGLLFILLMMDPVGHNHNHSTEHLLDWMHTIAPVLLLSYAVASLRFHFGLSPQDKSLSRRWLQRLLGPEAIIITGLLLGVSFALFQAFAVLLIGAFLTYSKVELTDPHDTKLDSATRFGFGHLVDRSAPWIVLSLILANLIGHPAVPLSSPIVQVTVLLIVFLPMRFCNLGAAVLSLSLAYSGWTTTAVMLPLIAAPIINFAQLKLMNWPQRSMLLVLLFVLLVLVEWLHPQWQQVLHLPNQFNSISLGVVAALFAASLLRLGPRKFMSRLIVRKTKSHEHSHDNDTEHAKEHHH